MRTYILLLYDLLKHGSCFPAITLCTLVYVVDDLRESIAILAFLAF